MLSRLHDERVFTGSQDVVFSEVSDRDAQQRLLGATPATTPRGMRKQLTRRQLGDAEHKGEESESDGASSGADSDEDDDDEEEELLRNSRHPPSSRYHPQHPYNAQLLMLAKKNQQQPVNDTLARNGDKAAAFVYKHQHQPMEFVFLPNGEIRPRDECPPGLALPPPATQASLAAEESHQHNNLLAEDAYGDRGGMQRQQQHIGSAPSGVRASARPETSHNRVAAAAKTATSQRPGGATISIVGYTKKERMPRRSRSSSESSDSSSERNQSSAAKRRHNNNNNVEASQRSENSASEASDGDSSSSDSEDEGKENARQQGGARGTTLKQRGVEKSSAKRADAVNSRPVAASATRSSSISRTKSAEPDARTHKIHSEPLRVLPQVESEDHEQQQSNRRGKVQSQTQVSAREKHRKAPLPSPSSASDASQSAWSRRPKAVKYEDLQSKPTHAEDAKQQKKSTKMDVRDLLSENSRVRVLKTKPSREQSEKIEFLEQELQKEKKRVLEKMTQLLEEQGKNQQLQHQVDVFQSQLVSKQRDAESKAKEVLKSKDESLGHVEAQWKARVKALEDQLHVKDAAVAHLQSETEHMKSTVAKLKDRERQSSSQSKDKETSANHQFEKILAKLKKFRARVENWKASSKEAMEVCDRKADLLSLMDTLWLDFPAFPSFLEVNGETKASTGEKQNDGNENANMILFLKKRLRLREDELHQTHVKYSELKELCARQCVREADLQNFINEHRLRGNLIIRKDEMTPIENHANVGRRNVQFQEQQQQQQRSEAKKKAIVNRGTNTTPTYYEEAESDEEECEEYDEYEEDDDGGRVEDDDEDEHQAEYYVREPKVFVQVGRDGVYEHTPPRSSAVLRKLEEDQARHARKKKESREVERIRLVPSSALARRYKRVPAPTDEYVVAAARRKAPSMSTPPRSATIGSNRLVRPPSISGIRTAGVVRLKSAQMPSAARANGTRTMSHVSSRVSRSASVPWV